MDIETIAATNDIHPRIAARAMINLLRKGLVVPTEGSAAEAIADLEARLAEGRL